MSEKKASINYSCIETISDLLIYMHRTLINEWTVRLSAKTKGYCGYYLMRDILSFFEYALTRWQGKRYAITRPTTTTTARTASTNSRPTAAASACAKWHSLKNC